MDVADGELNTEHRTTEELVKDLETQLLAADDLGVSRSDLLHMLLNTEPYSRDIELKNKMGEL